MKSSPAALKVEGSQGHNGHKTNCWPPAVAVAMSLLARPTTKLRTLGNHPSMLWQNLQPMMLDFFTDKLRSKSDATLQPAAVRRGSQVAELLNAVSQDQSNKGK